MQKTKFFHNKEQKWLLIDAKDRILGRLATRIARILQGKNKAIYTPNAICGDKVIVINAKHVKVTANKLETKIYDKYTGYPGGRKTMGLKTLMAKNPSKVLYLAVKGMLPKSHLGNTMLKSLKIYDNDKHEQEAQKPQLIEV